MLEKAIFKYKKESSDKVFGLKEAQNVLFDILERFQHFCDDYGVSISLTYGSLLGAIRDKNIIKWDDDIDLMIDGENLVKLKKQLNNLDKYGLAYYSYETTKRIYTNEIRIYISGYYRVLDNNGTKFITPLCIDIFPFEKINVDASGTISSQNKKRLSKIKKYKDLLVIKEAKYNSKTKFRAFLRSCRKMLHLLPTSSALHKKLDKTILKLYDSKSDYCLFSPYAGRTCNVLFNKKLIKECEKVQFGKMKAYSIKDADSFLTKIYGDWRTPVDESGGNNYNNQFIQK